MVNLQKLQDDFKNYSENWVDTPESNAKIYDYFEKEVDSYDFLTKHIDVVTKHSLGYGEKAFRYLWLLVFAQMQKDDKFLEIGVFKGSILALSQLCAEAIETDILSYGLTPLDNVGDKYSSYKKEDYEYCISYLYHLLGLTTDRTTIIPGLSTDEVVKQKAAQEGPYSVVYIDGGHDYETVVSDIAFTDTVLKPGGLLVMDDASSLLHLGPNHRGFDGHREVGLAIRDTLDNSPNYKHLFACGHNRVWVKL
jgi:hypothetical protein